MNTNADNSNPIVDALFEDNQSTDQTPDTPDEPEVNTDVDFSTKRIGQCMLWNARKGYGKIRDIHTNEEFFAHHSQLRPIKPPLYSNFNHTLYTGEFVHFSIGQNAHHNNQPCAVDITGLYGNSMMCDHACWRRIIYRN